MSEKRGVSIGCYYPRCTESISRDVLKGRKMSDAHEELFGIAGEVGWVIGLDEYGQAHYGCQYHGPALFNPSPLQDFRPLFRRRYRRALEQPALVGQVRTP